MDEDEEVGREDGEDWERIWSFLGVRLGGVGEVGVWDGGGIVAARAEAKSRAVAVDQVS